MLFYRRRRMMNRRLIILIIAIFAFTLIFSCQTPKRNTRVSPDILFLTYLNENRIKPLELIDNPSANTINTNEFQVKLRLYHTGGMLGGLTAGLSKQLQFGITYGGQHIIGHERVEWNKSPGINIRYKLKFMQQSKDLYWPDIAIGFDSQGYGAYFADSLNRYQIKSKGVYLAVSDYVKVMSSGIPGFGYHAGINYSTENKKQEKDINFFCGIHFNVDYSITLLWEYDFAINDNDDNSFGSGKGYMNAALRWYFSPKFALEFSAKNLLNNSRALDGVTIPKANRELKIIYFQSLDFMRNSK